MGTMQHINSLSNKHAQLDDLIAREAQRPMPDWMLLAQLKKEKLKLKEALARA